MKQYIGKFDARKDRYTYSENRSLWIGIVAVVTVIVGLWIFR